MERSSGKKTLFASVLLSAPGPVVVGVGLLLGRSSTQLADFMRRTAELIAILVAWAVYNATHKREDMDAQNKARLERIANLCVGAAMCVSGAAMLVAALFSGGGEKGNVIPGLAIAILGVITNTWFWFRYRRLDRNSPNAILAVQSRLYRAKSLVDTCVTAALAAVAIAPASATAHYMDIAGSVVVAAYLAVSGAITLRGKNARAEA